MRTVIVLLAAAVAAALAAHPLQAQWRPPAPQPLPSALTPTPAAAPPGALDCVERGMLTGTVVGLAAGGLFGAFGAPECDGTADGCSLSPAYRTMIFAIIGGALGAVAGGAAGLVLGGDGGWDAAVRPAADGGMAVGATRRH